jgi:hypothetical protein
MENTNRHSGQSERGLDWILIADHIGFHLTVLHGTSCVYELIPGPNTTHDIIQEHVREIEKELLDIPLLSSSLDTPTCEEVI